MLQVKKGNVVEALDKIQERERLMRLDEMMAREAFYEKGFKKVGRLELQRVVFLCYRLQCRYFQLYTVNSIVYKLLDIPFGTQCLLDY